MAWPHHRTRQPVSRRAPGPLPHRPCQPATPHSLSHVAHRGPGSSMASPSIGPCPRGPCWPVPLPPSSAPSCPHGFPKLPLGSHFLWGHVIRCHLSLRLRCPTGPVCSPATASHAPDLPGLPSSPPGAREQPPAAPSSGLWPTGSSSQHPPRPSSPACSHLGGPDPGGLTWDLSPHFLTALPDSGDPVRSQEQSML